MQREVCRGGLCRKCRTYTMRVAHARACAGQCTQGEVNENLCREVYACLCRICRRHVPTFKREFCLRATVQAPLSTELLETGIWEGTSWGKPMEGEATASRPHAPPPCSRKSHARLAPQGLGLSPEQSGACGCPCCPCCCCCLPVPVYMSLRHQYLHAGITVTSLCDKLCRQRSTWATP